MRKQIKNCAKQTNADGRIMQKVERKSDDLKKKHIDDRINT